MTERDKDSPSFKGFNILWNAMHYCFIASCRFPPESFERQYYINGFNTIDNILIHWQF